MTSIFNNVLLRQNILVAATSTFSPADIAGLEIWVDASDLSTLFQDSAKTTPVANNNDPVGCWVDKSSNAREFTQGTAANKPVYKTADTSIEFNVSGGNKNLQLAATFNLADYTFFAVAKQNFIPVGFWNGIFGWSGLGDMACTCQQSNTYGFGLTCGGAGGERFSTTATTPTAYKCMTFQKANLYYNSVEPSYGIAQNGTTFTVGEISSSTNTYTFRGQIQEIIAYNSTLDATNRALVETYLIAKWSIT